MDNIYSLVDDEGDEVYMAVKAEIPVATVKEFVGRIEKEWYEKESPDFLVNEIIEGLPSDWNAHLVTLHTIQL